MNENSENLFVHEKPLESLIALDVAFSCLIENIRNTNRPLAESLAIDLQDSAQRIPLHLPENGHGAVDILERWAKILKSDPSFAGPGQSN